MKKKNTRINMSKDYIYIFNNVTLRLSNNATITLPAYFNYFKYMTLKQDTYNSFIFLETGTLLVASLNEFKKRFLFVLKIFIFIFCFLYILDVTLRKQQVSFTFNKRRDIKKPTFNKKFLRTLN
jgi:hypothetical protein